jgi:hypothetical protein
VVCPWTLATAGVQPGLCQCLSPLKLAPLAGDHLNTLMRQMGCGAHGRTPFHARVAHHRLTHGLPQRMQVRRIQILRLLTDDREQMGSRHPESRP